MNLQYKIKIDKPENHIVSVRISGEKKSNLSKLELFLPSWSPGSYLMREYSRHVSKFRVSNTFGEIIHYDQVQKGTWEIDWEISDLKNSGDKFIVEYDVYCHELTVRTSHITREHAFLHGPTYLMGVVGETLEKPTLEVKFPPTWSKITTGLNDISTQREIFIYEADNYDVLIDAPLEIGCHETDGEDPQVDARLFGWPVDCLGDCRQHLSSHHGVRRPGEVSRARKIV